MPDLHLVVASSAATLTLFLFDWDRRLWIKKANLVDLTNPIISVDHATLDPKPAINDAHQATGVYLTLKTRGDRVSFVVVDDSRLLHVIVAGGSTNGDVHLWDVAFLFNDGSSSDAKSDSMQSLSPIVSFENRHQLGVNSLSLILSSQKCV